MSRGKESPEAKEKEKARRPDRLRAEPERTKPKERPREKPKPAAAATSGGHLSRGRRTIGSRNVARNDKHWFSEVV